MRGTRERTGVLVDKYQVLSASRRVAAARPVSSIKSYEIKAEELAAARARNDKLIVAEDVLAVAYDKLIELNLDVVSARMELIAAKDEVIAVKAMHQRDERELAAAEMQEMGTKAELARALGDLAVQELRGRSEDTHRQRPWWWRR